MSHPGANVPDGTGNRTDWPLSGGSLTLDLHHTWTYLFINLGLGENVTNFNISLTGGNLWNSTGSGTLCIPKLPVDLPDVQEGANATLQVVTVGDGGSALYNCADVRLVEEVEEFGGEECETEGIEYYIVGEAKDPVTSDGEVPEVSEQGKSGSDEEEDGGDLETIAKPWRRFFEPWEPGDDEK